MIVEIKLRIDVPKGKSLASYYDNFVAFEDGKTFSRVLTPIVFEADGTPIFQSAALEYLLFASRQIGKSDFFNELEKGAEE